MLHEVRMSGEVVVLAVLKNEKAIGIQKSSAGIVLSCRAHVLPKNEIGQGREFLQGVGWVGKDKVKLLFACLQETEHVATDSLAPNPFPKGDGSR